MKPSINKKSIKKSQNKKHRMFHIYIYIYIYILVLDIMDQTLSDIAEPTNENVVSTSRD